jgi:ribose-phosphate pyrophosphokinase
MEFAILTMGPETSFIKRFQVSSKHVRIDTKKFSDGEFFAKIANNIRNKQCYLVVQMNAENVFDVIVTIDTLKRAHASKVTLVTPYLPYCRQDRRADVRTPVSAKVLANCLEAAGCDHIITMDVHALQIEGFYNIPFDNLQGSTKVLDKLIERENLSNYVFVAPDAGAAKRTRHLADIYGRDVVILDKKRVSDIDVESYLIGDVKGKDCIMVDDMIASGGTIQTGAVVLKDGGANRIFVACSHLMSEKGAIRSMTKTDGLYHLNTIPHLFTNVDKKHYVVTCEEMFAEAVQNDINGESISSMFDQKRKYL